MAAAGGDAEDQSRNLRESIAGYQRQATEARRATGELTAAEQKSEREAQLVAQAHREAANGTQQLEQRLQGSTRALGNSSDALRRHGALTTEFIQAAAKGQVTIRELGFQVGATVAKFGGWTAAASLVYGAAAAIGQLGTGAVNSLEGVTQLTRIVNNVNTEEAQQQFRDLAREFNLPIDQVATATYEMSRVFKDQNQASDAARVALRAMSVAELDAGSSTRYLSAIVRGFGLDASDLPLILDQINQATNKFGGNTGQLVEGVSKAGGQFRAAGGDIQYLISLIEAGTQLTGRTGGELGTAIQRSAEILQRPEKRAKIIDLLGIDPKDHSIEEVYEAAFKRAQGATGAQATAIASALSTPQLATRITPILQNRAFFEQINKTIDPNAPGTVGSAARENENRLKGFREEAQRLIIDLQRMGSALAQSGALDPFAVMFRSLDGVLNGVTRLIELLDVLPRPVRSTIFAVAELSAGLALLRRFNVGGSIPARFPALGSALSRNPGALERAQIQQGLGDETRFTQERLQRTGQDRALADYHAVRAAERRNEVAARVQAGTATDADLARAQERVNRFEAEALELKENQADLAARYATVQRQSTNLDRRVRAGQPVRDAASAEGIYYSTGGLDRPSSRPPVLIDQAGRERGRTPADTGARTFVVGAGGAGSTEIKRSVDELERNSASLSQAVRDSRQGLARAGVSGRVLGTALTGLAAPVVAAARGVRNIGTGAAEFARAAVAGLGPLDVALVGFTALIASYESIKSYRDKYDAELDNLNKGVGGPNVLADRARSVLDQSGGPLDQVRDFAASLIDLNTPDALFGPVGTQHQVNQQIAAAQKREAEAIIKAQGQDVGLTGDQIRTELDASLKGADSAKERRAAIDKANRQLAVSFDSLYGLGDEDEKRMEQATRDYVKSVRAQLDITQHGLHAALEAVTDAAGLTTFQENLGTGVGLYGLNRQRGRAGGEAITRARELLATTLDPAEQAKILAQIQAIESDVLGEAEKSLQNLLAQARNPREQAQARATYTAQARNAYGIPQLNRQIKAVQDRIADRSKTIDRAESELNKAEQAREGARLAPPKAFNPLDPNSAIPNDVQSAIAREGVKRDNLHNLRVQQREDEKVLEQYRQQLGLSREAFKALLQDQAKAQFQAELANFDARTAVQTSRTADPVKQAQITATRLHERTQRLQEAYRQHLASEDELFNAVAAENQAQQQLAQSQLSRFQARQQLGASQFALTHRDPGAVLQHSLGDAQAYADRVRQEVAAGNLDPTELLNAEKAVADARKAVADNLREQAEAMLSAQEAYALAGTNDALEQARIRAQYAQRRVTDTPADTAAGRLQQRADARSANDDARQAAYQNRYDDLAFAHDMGRVTDQVYAQQLRDLASTVKNNKQLKRQLLLEAHRLEEEMKGDSLQLNVGDIRLPSTYEIRRAIGGGQRPSNVQVTNAPKVAVTVSSDADIKKFAETMDLVLNTNTAAALKSSGVLR